MVLKFIIKFKLDIYIFCTLGSERRGDWINLIDHTQLAVCKSFNTFPVSYDFIRKRAKWASCKSYTSQRCLDMNRKFNNCLEKVLVSTCSLTNLRASSLTSRLSPFSELFCVCFYFAFELVHFLLISTVSGFRRFEMTYNKLSFRVRSALRRARS